MDNIEIIDPLASNKTSRKLIENAMEDAAFGIKNMVERVHELGLEDKINIDATWTAKDVYHANELFNTFAVDMDMLLAERDRVIGAKEESIDVLKGTLSHMSSALKATTSQTGDIKKILDNQNKVYEQIDNLTSAIKNNNSISENEVIKQLVEIIKSQDTKLTSIENKIAGTCNGTNSLVLVLKNQLKNIENLIDTANRQLDASEKQMNMINDNIKSIAGSYMLKHKTELDPNYKPGRKKKVEDDLFISLYKKCNGNINQVKHLLSSEHHIDISWSALHKKAKNLGYK
jgi:DNA gyrase/topoisomerase IV subunit A